MYGVFMSTAYATGFTTECTEGDLKSCLSGTPVEARALPSDEVTPNPLHRADSQRAASVACRSWQTTRYKGFTICQAKASLEESRSDSSRSSDRSNPAIACCARPSEQKCGLPNYNRSCCSVVCVADPDERKDARAGSIR